MRRELRPAAQYAIQEGTSVIMMMSRVSPEKGQDRLLKALEIWERSDDFPPGACVCCSAALRATHRPRPMKRA